jgi:hypothetical protein
MGWIYQVSDRAEIDRRRQALPGVLIEVWPDLHAGDLFWLGDDETRRAAYASEQRARPRAGLHWIGETSKAALEGTGEPLAWDLALDEAAVPIYYGPQLADADSLPREDSVRARALSVHAIAVVWATYDRFGVRVEHPPPSPLDPSFYLRRPGGKTVHLFHTLRTKTEAMTVMAERTSYDSDAIDWAEALPAEDFADLLQRHAVARR